MDSIDNFNLYDTIADDKDDLAYNNETQRNCDIKYNFLVWSMVGALVALLFCWKIQQDISRNQNKGSDHSSIRWIRLHDEVFQPPNHKLLFSVLIASGVKYIINLIFTVAFGLYVYNIYKEGYKQAPSITYELIIYLILIAFGFFVSGHVGVQVHAGFKGAQWKLATLLVAIIDPLCAFITFIGILLSPTNSDSPPDMLAIDFYDTMREVAVTKWLVAILGILFGSVFCTVSGAYMANWKAHNNQQKWKAVDEYGEKDVSTRLRVSNINFIITLIVLPAIAFLTFLIIKNTSDSLFIWYNLDEFIIIVEHPFLITCIVLLPWSLLIASNIFWCFVQICNGNSAWQSSAYFIAGFAIAFQCLFFGLQFYWKKMDDYIMSVSVLLTVFGWFSSILLGTISYIFCLCFIHIIYKSVNKNRTAKIFSELSQNSKPEMLKTL